MLPLPIAAAKTNLQAEMRALPDVETGKDQSGSTAVMTLLSPTHVICSNTGDSRAVLCRGGCRGSESKRRSTPPRPPRPPRPPVATTRLGLAVACTPTHPPVALSAPEPRASPPHTLARA